MKSIVGKSHLSNEKCTENICTENEFKISFPTHTVEFRVLQNVFVWSSVFPFLSFDVQVMLLLKITPLFSGLQSLIRRDIFSMKQDQKSVGSKSC